MSDKKNNIYLYEAIELRAEYEARITTLKSLLPEARENRDRFSFRRDDETKYRPVANFSVDEVREELRNMENKKRKLNNAIQYANFENHITVSGQEMNLAEALELRKSVNGQIGELSTQLVSSALSVCVTPVSVHASSVHGLLSLRAALWGPISLCQAP